MGNKQSHKVLVVDDESDILELLEYNLTKEGYEVETAQDGKTAVEKAQKFQPQLILLDIMMPNQDGVETCRQLRETPESANSFIIFLTARSEEYSEVAAFENGADDYITKPIKPRALMSRINAYFRRDVKKQKDNNKITIGGLTIDRTSYTVSVDGKQVSLPKKEFELLYFLAQNPNKVFNRDDLLQNIWGSDVYVLARTVDVHVRKVREKVGDGYISTVKGVGYKFDME
ncbi:DNA-binding response regulator [Marivirga tractuosa]|uniref:Phosphate regulon transcriptional regulatory protein PhoB n=1 Tax=Marivirga tractuosa (strain ATCC 23168 / DSM 4126 / NBRC 15989 / NCIMB 1408 / VKM B-1430 / H-43) TaxID=643867 RepID=E4TLR6_MARTH|nr:response regulator transcription factor [Marivirga tractuosa]ADR23345.1 two component transcriptional regulator, winged helix family [Marivirga tractuosa DSM 4126]BDD15981.1 DNA-binding response regulator [Marivirga tractuosa]